MIKHIIYTLLLAIMIMIGYKSNFDINLLLYGFSGLKSVGLGLIYIIISTQLILITPLLLVALTKLIKRLDN